MRRSRWASALAFVVLAACGRAAAPSAVGAPATAEPAGELVNGVEAPVLGAPTGWHFAMVAGGLLLDVDLDTGRISTRDGMTGGARRMFATPDGLVVTGVGPKRGTGFLPHSLDEVRDLGIGTPDLRTGRTVWTVTSDEGSLTVTEVGADGAVRRSRRIAVDNDAQPVLDDFHAAGVVGNELVLAARGHLLLVDLATGAVRPWADGAPVGVGGDRIVWRGCTADHVCTTYAGTAADPRAVRLETEATLHAVCDGGFEGQYWPLTCPLSVASGGGVLLAQGDGPYAADAVTTWDLTTGARRRLSWPTSRLAAQINSGEEFGVFDVMLSPDGSWLFGVQTTGRITAVERATGRTVEFDVIRPVDQAEGLVTAFAVG